MPSPWASGRPPNSIARRVMPECHMCQHKADIEAGKYACTPWRKTPCAGCHWTGDQANNHGRSHISIDSGADSSQTYGEVEASVSASEISKEMIGRSSQEVLDTAADRQRYRRAIGAGLLLLTEAERRVVRLLVKDPMPTQSQIAKTIGRTPQNVSALLRQVRRKWPAFARAFPGCGSC